MERMEPLGVLTAWIVVLASACTSGGPVEAPTATPTALPGTTIACGPGIRQAPCVDGVEIGARYPFRLFTHCGVNDSWFDGKLWVASPPLGEGNAPKGWGFVNFVDGTMTKRREDLAVFEAGPDRVASFRPAEAGDTPHP